MQTLVALERSIARDGGLDVGEDGARHADPRRPEVSGVGKRHVLGQRLAKSLEQQREAGAWPRPRHGDQAVPAPGGRDAWTGGQEHLMLEDAPRVLGECRSRGIPRPCTPDSRSGRRS